MNTNDINALLERAGVEKVPDTIRVWNTGGRHGLGKQVESLQNTLLLCNMHRQALADALKKVLDERDAALAKQSKWIKLTEDDRPPDGYYNVMVKKRGVLQRDLLRYDANDDDWWKELSTQDELVPGYLITHWMPLPEAPEEEG